MFFALRIALVVLTLVVAIFLFKLSSDGKRKLAKIWVLGGAIWVLSCWSVVVDPYPPSDITDIETWQGVSFMFELAIRAGVFVVTLLLSIIYYLSPLKDIVKDAL